MAYNSMSGLSGWSVNPFAAQNDPTSQYSILNRENAVFGTDGTNLTNEALASNTNLDVGADGSFFGGIKGGLQNKDLMSGITGMGQLGLGLANYFTMKPVYDEQLKGLKQNRQFAQADQARRDTTRANFDKALG